MSRVVVFGAGGILGQHMLVSQPEHHDTIFCRRTEDEHYYGVDLRDHVAVNDLLVEFKPNVVVNLAGENRVDIVEAHPALYQDINMNSAVALAIRCEELGIHLVQGSTQGVFSGDSPPYGPGSVPDPITEYGKQKHNAEKFISMVAYSSIARITFVLGVRPFRNIGRQNPLESMFEEPIQYQVNDRWFSPAFADDAALQLWKLVNAPNSSPKTKIVHIGEPTRVTRWQIALSTIHDTYRGNTGQKIYPVPHDYFPGIAPRPRDTTWAYGSMHDNKYPENIIEAYSQWVRRENGS
jgi:dTDP-4-dehydrorhamnose reductase